MCTVKELLLPPASTLKSPFHARCGERRLVVCGAVEEAGEQRPEGRDARVHVDGLAVLGAGREGGLGVLGGLGDGRAHGAGCGSSPASLASRDHLDLGVAAQMFPVEVKPTVFTPVAGLVERADLDHRLGPGGGPASARDVHPIADQVAARALDVPRRDGVALLVMRGIGRAEGPRSWRRGALDALSTQRPPTAARINPPKKSSAGT